MKPNFWQERWKAHQIGFHQDETEPLLVEHFPRLAPTKVFVPLCGKSLDMLWLAKQGHHVLGIELSEIACDEFFRENFPGQSPSKTQEGEFVAYRLGPFEIYQGDYSALSAQHLIGVSAVFDRAALIALPPEMRARYVAHLKKILPDQAELLLITIECPQDRAEGPPFSVSPEEVRRFYGDRFEIEHRGDEDISSYYPAGSGKLGGLPVRQHAFRMKG